jgi:hypothetical protein
MMVDGDSAAGAARRHMSKLLDYPTEDPEDAVPRTRRKPTYPISSTLSSYLAKFRRELELPVSYARLESFRESVPLTDAEGRDTLWETVVYRRRRWRRSRWTSSTSTRCSRCTAICR